MDIGANTPQEPEDATPRVAAPAEFDPAEVGAGLREVRLAQQRELSDVAGDLRIRQIYIQAIEDGRLSDLPGPAYTTGFLRAYSDYLGLDGREIVDRFKAAGGPSVGQTDLHLPSPVQEGRLPTGSVLLLAALLAVSAYGGWYYMASTGGDPVEKVAALPEHLAILIGEPTAATTEPTAATTEPATAATEPTARTLPPDGDAAAVPAGAAEGGTQAGPQTVAAAPDAAPAPPARRVTASPVRPVKRGGSPDPEGIGAAASGVAGAVSDNARTIETTILERAAVPADTATPTRPNRARASPAAPSRTREPDAIARSAMVAPQAGGGMIPLGRGASEAEKAKIATRIVLQANTDSWLEVRAGEADPVYSGLLREGDSYSVPDLAGLTLMTGNAGGIDILIDGRAIPRLGPPGSVKRNVVLDADRLLGRLAQ